MTPKNAAFVGAVLAGMVGLAQPGLACGDDDARPSKYQAESAACPAVRDIKTMPFYGEAGVDAAYDRFQFATDCDDVLIKTLTSLRPMTDLSCPSYSGFVEADAALFVLAKKHDIGIPDLMPESERAHWRAQGVYAYFAYVEDPKRRAKANARLLAQIAKQKNEAES
jgi:hypothetical protein